MGGRRLHVAVESNRFDERSPQLVELHGAPPHRCALADVLTPYLCLTLLCTFCDASPRSDLKLTQLLPYSVLLSSSYPTLLQPHSWVRCALPLLIMGQGPQHPVFYSCPSAVPNMDYEGERERGEQNVEQGALVVCPGSAGLCVA